MQKKKKEDATESLTRYKFESLTCTKIIQDYNLKEIMHGCNIVDGQTDKKKASFYVQKENKLKFSKHGIIVFLVFSFYFNKLSQ